ncbi:aldehyde dehydrogenase [Longirhabdus pacifica]|uniref:aldehyde dehydrogenase n=1 Tax=Longirhabdus pacifica TaxID=2305227 RepID=UPI001008C9C2|nr:aldehyde dehydrogenase [Longirhabdus pacifica]
MIENIVKKQKEYFKTGETKSIAFRIQQLNKLKDAIKQNEQEILDALQKDLGKPYFEGYTSEIGFVLDSIKNISKNLNTWAKDKKVKTPIHQVLSKSIIRSEPYGTVLIIGPFNYPFQLLIEPMLGALAAGNTVVLKPSEYTVQTEKIVQKIISETFDESYIAVVTGGKEETQQLLQQSFDYIFFTGSTRVGQIVMEAASKHLTPVTLELGGKSPTIVDKDANLEVATRRIAWGKFVNAGQTCVAPDYIYVHSAVQEQFKTELIQRLKEFYGENTEQSQDYGRIVNEAAFQRLTSLIDKNKTVYGGEHKQEDLYIAPTLLDNITWEDAVMEEEIFGPILPILTYDNVDDIIKTINNRPKPLALYVFTENKDVVDKILAETSSGGVSVNDVVSHLANPNLPFGGVGTAGMGAYHGQYSFDTFSHKKSILKKSTKVDSKIIFPPYKNKINLIRKILK